MGDTDDTRHCTTLDCDDDKMETLVLLLIYFNAGPINDNIYTISV